MTYTCRSLTPAGGCETSPARVAMVRCWRSGQHAHITLAHGTYGCHCGPGCRTGGIKEWKP